MTLSSADLKWNEIVSIVNKLHKLNMSQEEIENLTYRDRCCLLKSNPALVARHFQHHGQLEKTKYYAICVEFQVRGSPHVHCFLWVTTAPVLTSKNKEEYVTFVDQIVHAFLPDRNENPELHNLVKLYQLHRKSRTCRKYKNEPGLNLESFSRKTQQLQSLCLKICQKKLRCWFCAKETKYFIKSEPI